MKIAVEIPEVHKTLVEIEVPDGATKEEILKAAQSKFEAGGSNDLEYSHTLDDDEWTIRDYNGNFFGEEGFGT